RNLLWFEFNTSVVRVLTREARGRLTSESSSTCCADCVVSGAPHRRSLREAQASILRRTRLTQVLYSPVIHDSTECSRFARKVRLHVAAPFERQPAAYLRAAHDSLTAALQRNHEFGQRRAHSKGMTRGYSVFVQYRNWLSRPIR